MSFWMWQRRFYWNQHYVVFWLSRLNLRGTDDQWHSDWLCPLYLLFKPTSAAAYPDDTGPPAGHCVPPHHKNCTNNRRNVTKSSISHLASECPGSQFDFTPWDMLIYDCLWECCWHKALLCLKQYLGGLYWSKNIHMNSRTQGSH